ncbi:MAG: 4-hydroxy-3-methylbut-2-enyl diphosphate reductase [Clostridia bacterium]|nr:4-hydroxy-3-methylbut-2-enyl diphosphate reductase [Clostridia bacterium]
MKVTVARNAGFCFGVKRATDELEGALLGRSGKERIYTLGTLIHNETYNKWLAEQGAMVTDISQIPEIARSACEQSPVTVFVRAHGIPVEHETVLKGLAEENQYFKYRDCTCPFVKKIHRIASENSRPENFFILLGSASHPEVVGIMSYFAYDKAVVADAEELERLLRDKLLVECAQKVPILAAQTTQNLSEWKKSQEILKKLYTNALIFDTICSVTESRQTETQSLSSECDCMIVIGGRESSNTAKLYSICKESCPQTFWIEKPEELCGCNLITSAHTKVGIAAGASTPSSVIQEVYKTMSEMNENFAELFDATEIKTLNTGDTVVGTVTSVTDAELYLDLGAQVTGLIKAEQITDDASVKLTEAYKPGDQIEAFVIRVSDIEGFAELSKKRVDSDKNWQKIVAAAESGEVLCGKVVEVVRGGVSVSVDANRVFVPASQTGVPKDESLDTIKGKEVSLKVIEIKGKKAVGSIRIVEREEKRAREAAFWAAIEEGKVFTGPVKSMTAYGAFIDLGGVDGMVHKSELSWKPISTPASVLEVGQVVEVFVKSFDAEKKRISLGYKKECDNPWYVFTSKYAVGDTASVKIVNMMPFAAFAEIVEGVDGLIHISQIAQQRIGKPADVLEIGQVVDAKITAIDEENHKVSLSIRALLDEAQAAAEAMTEEAVEASEAVDAE